MILRKIFFIPILLPIILFVSSCSGQTTDVTPTAKTVVKKIKTITSGDNIQSYAYDSIGRVKKYTLKTNAATTVYEYIYSKSSVTANTTLTKSDGKTYKGSDVAPLNSQGYIQSFGTISYEYDKNGYKIKESYTDGSFVLFQNNEGNYIRETRNNPNDVSEITNDFYDDHKNTIEGEYNGFLFTGKANKNPIKKTTILVNKLPNSTDNYTYEYDKDDYITKQTITTTIVSNSTSGTKITTYTYQ